MLLMLFASAVPLVSNPSYVYKGQKQFQSKRPIDEVIVTVDYTNSLASGETLKSVVWIVDVVEGVDNNPEATLTGTTTTTGNTVLHMFSGGIDGVRYAPFCAATTSQGQVLSLPPSGYGTLLVKEL